MNTATGILDPRGSATTHKGGRAPRLASLDGTSVALIDNGKPNANLLLDAVADRLRARGVSSVATYTKSIVGTPIDQQTLEQIQQTADFAIAAVGDCGSCSAGTAQDSLVLERNGVPSISICTEPFGVTARAMAKSYGEADFDFVLTRHPIASLTAEAIGERADQITERAVAILTGASND